ncbi:unnamed protein product [Ceratitis capitata]|uniref:(Mediterranean fruit fly) hypothetical protein n=1 Tax=Ceratitis capitata TaxID=7213 RepID=A0A811V5S7_CERCA|nr:unnamed protein product [Ceratitis capitata]
MSESRGANYHAMHLVNQSECCTLSATESTECYQFQPTNEPQTPGSKTATPLFNSQMLAHNIPHTNLQICIPFPASCLPQANLCYELLHQHSIQIAIMVAYSLFLGCCLECAVLRLTARSLVTFCVECAASNFHLASSVW